jgi:hypothetical protein
MDVAFPHDALLNVLNVHSFTADKICVYRVDTFAHWRNSRPAILTAKSRYIRAFKKLLETRQCRCRYVTKYFHNRDYGSIKKAIMNPRLKVKRVSREINFTYNEERDGDNLLD